jgi:acyl-CoA thioesterase-2
MTTLEDLRRLVSVEAVDDWRSKGETVAIGPGVSGLFGGQVIAQCLAATEHTVPAGAMPDSIHASLLRRGQAGAELELEVTEIHSGRALQQRSVRAVQDSELVAEATVVSSMPAQGLDWQAQPSPVAEPPDSELDSHFGQILGNDVIETFRPAGTSPDARMPPLWVRTPVGMPRDPWLAAATLAYWSDFGMNGSTREALVSLTGDEYDKIASLSATHALWLHRPVAAGEWHLLDVTCETLAGNNGFVLGTFHDAVGRRVATVNQRVYVRRPLE